MNVDDWMGFRAKQSHSYSLYVRINIERSTHTPGLFLWAFPLDSFTRRCRRHEALDVITNSGIEVIAAAPTRCC